MSNYLSRLAARTGLLNQSQGATAGAAPGPQEGTQAVQQHLEIHNERSTIQAPVSVKPDTGSITHTSAQVNTAKTLLSSMHHEEKTALHESGPIAEHSSKPNIQNPIEHHQTLLAERRMAAVVAERFENDPPAVTSPVAEAQQTSPGSSSVATDSDLPALTPHTNERPADLSANIDTSGLVLHHDALDTSAIKTNDTSPPEDKPSNASVVKSYQVEPLVSEPVVRVPESKPVNNMTRMDSNQTRQHGESRSEQQFKQKPDNQSQINIQSITLEVHQPEPERIPAPAPVSRNHVPAPKQPAPSQTRLSRYYLKGW